MNYKEIIDNGFKERRKTKVLLNEYEAEMIYHICVGHFLKNDKLSIENDLDKLKNQKENPHCPNCGGVRTWCDLCQMYSSRCCETYGTCLCS